MSALEKMVELVIAARDFTPASGSPALADERWRLDARTTQMGLGDAIEHVLDVSEGDRIVSLEPDIAIELGYMRLDLVEHNAAGDRPLLQLDCTTPSAPRPFPVRRTIRRGSRVVLRIEAELDGINRYVHGAYVRIVKHAS